MRFWKGNMQKAFLKYCNEIGLGKDDKILVALSGGLDSVALLYLMHMSGFYVEVAHCNFNLRGEESDADAQFVKELCAALGLPVHVKNFDTAAHANDFGVSIQMAARDLRYAWFEELRSKNGLAYIATAHHRDDQVETVLINFSRGTGLKGMQGMKPLQNKIIRPLLFTDRSALELWMQKEKYAYREDSSNTSIKYTRNKLRHQVIPILKMLNPSLSTTVQENVERFAGSETNLSFLLEKERQNIVLQKGTEQHFILSALTAYPSPSSVLYNFISDFGFHDWKAIENMLNSESGKIIYSQTHALLKDREVLVLREKKTVEQSRYLIEKTTPGISSPLQMQFSCVPAKDFKINTSSLVAALDYDKLTFPLELRKWKEGDAFQPLGLKGKKKLSDFFIDQKKNIFEKENTWLLCSDNQIVWVVGSRIDERFKLVEKTQKVYLAELNDVFGK